MCVVCLDNDHSRLFLLGSKNGRNNNSHQDGTFSFGFTGSSARSRRDGDLLGNFLLVTFGEGVGVTRAAACEGTGDDADDEGSDDAGMADVGEASADISGVAGAREELLEHLGVALGLGVRFGVGVRMRVRPAELVLLLIGVGILLFVVNAVDADDVFLEHVAVGELDAALFGRDDDGVDGVSVAGGGRLGTTIFNGGGHGAHDARLGGVARFEADKTESRDFRDEDEDQEAEGPAALHVEGADNTSDGCREAEGSEVVEADASFVFVVVVVFFVVAVRTFIALTVAVHGESIILFEVMILVVPLVVRSTDEG